MAYLWKPSFANFYLHELHNTQLVFFMWNIKNPDMTAPNPYSRFQACINNPSVLSRYRSARCLTCLKCLTHVETDWCCPLCAILTQSDKIWSVVYWCNVDWWIHFSIWFLHHHCTLTCICVISPGLRKSLCNKWEFWEIRNLTLWGCIFTKMYMYIQGRC